MQMNPDLCYRVLQARDARFDGQFFVAVRTTKIYCRPICPVPTPKLENCFFFPNAEAAHAAGFRPCLRCRPELAPTLSPLCEAASTVARALNLIAQGVPDESKVRDLAEQLGLGERQLRGMFLEYVGASPLSILQARRILFAKQLLDETALSVTEVVLAAGFRSIRRFNEVM